MRPEARNETVVDGAQAMKRRLVSSGEKATSLRYNLMELAADMDDVISLGRGDPDLDTPPEIIEGALARMSSVPTTMPVRGLAELRRAIACHYEVDKGISFDPDSEIIVTNGGQEALFLTMLALVDPGDRVATPDPRYPSYDQAIGAAGGDLVEIPTGRDLRFELDAEDLRCSIDGAKILVLVNPSNPTGAFVRADGVRSIAEAARDLGLVVVSDEIYEEVVYDGEELLSMAACDDMRGRTVTLSGFSKAYAMTGFRVGYLLGDPAYIDAIEKLKALTSGPCPLLSQNAALAALDDAPHVPAAFREIYQRRRDRMVAGLDTMGIPHGHAGGGLFMWADVASFGVPAEEFCLELLRQSGVLMFPGRAFGDKWEYFVRISLLVEEAKIVEALERVGDFVDSLDRDAG